MEFKQLMSEVGVKCGIGEIPVDEDGVAMLQADGILLSFIEIPATQQLVTYAVVAEKPEGSLERLYETLFEAQYLGAVTSGATFSLSPDGEIVLHRMDALVDMDVATLMKTMETFLNLVDKWREVIGAYRPDELPQNDDDANVPGLGLGMDSGFMTV